MSIEAITLIMFGSLLLLLVVGIPIVHVVAVSSLVCSYLLWGPQSIFGMITSCIGTMSNWTLVAVPLFSFMSIYLFETGMVEDLYDTFYRFTGHIRGGLAVCSIIVGALMGAMTGVVAGTVIALTTIAYPQMRKYGYDDKISIGAILSGGTLGQLIPPSTVMILYGSMTGVSVGALFAGGLTTGCFLAAIYCIYVLIRCYTNKNLCAKMPEEERKTFRENLPYLKPIVSPLLLILLVLGSIFQGIATPTEAASVGCVGAMLIAILRKKFTFSALINSSKETLKMTSMVGYITFTAIFFGQVFTGLGGQTLVINLTSNIPGGPNGTIFVLLLITFVLGMFLDTGAIIVICAPIFTTVIKALGVNPTWFAVLFITCIQTSYLSPPFGYSLFYMKSSAPKDVSLSLIYKSAIPFLVLQALGVTICLLIPDIITKGIELFL